MPSCIIGPSTVATYATMDEAVEFGENPDDIVMVEGRKEAVDALISKMHNVDSARQERNRQAAKKRRLAAEASRRKNRRKK